ncbi:hypothetical protein DL768_006182 [Monosporascus sp. mg162]|nr:hypothetical protein DL768_006182 [Monosporascus sp. mg162]
MAESCIPPCANDIPQPSPTTALPPAASTPATTAKAAALTPRHPFLDRPYTTCYHPCVVADAYRDASSAPRPVAISTAPYYPYAGPRQLHHQPHRRRLGFPAPDCAHGPREPGPCVRAELLWADLAQPPRRCTTPTSSPRTPDASAPSSSRSRGLPRLTRRRTLSPSGSHPGTPGAGGVDFV